MQGMGMPVSFFLGANNKAGYCSLMSELYNPYENGRHFILKGGPGTGKSTLMKKAAVLLEKRGYAVERCYCSADPSSLDAVSAPEIGFSIVDGTAPHVVDPVLPGVSEYIVDLSAAWDIDYLREHAPEIRRLTSENKRIHKKCADYLWVAASLKQQTAAYLGKYLLPGKLENFGSRLIARELAKKEHASTGRAMQRFLSGITPDGVVVQYDTIASVCSRVIPLEDEWGVYAPSVMKRIAAEAIERGYRVYVCRCALTPRAAPEQLLIPELGLCFFTENPYHRAFPGEARMVHASRFLSPEVSECREKLAFARTAQKELIDEAVRKLSVAKGIHDSLEEFYIKATDFSVIEEKGAAILKQIGI